MEEKVNTWKRRENVRWTGSRQESKTEDSKKQVQ